MPDASFPMTRYLTSSIPYVNGLPHIGHALECIQVDTLLRYYRAKGETVRGQFGSDDNSLKKRTCRSSSGRGCRSLCRTSFRRFSRFAAAVEFEF